MVGTVTFNQAMLAKDRVFAIRAGAYTSSDIKEASFNYGYISGDTFKPGGTVAGSAKLTFTSIITTFNKLDKIYPEIGLLVGDSYEWVAMGEYFVNDISIDRNRNTTELDLMDGMFKLNQPYISDLTYPAQIRDVIREICAKTGIELETDNFGLRAIQHHIQTKPDKKDITCREVLSQAIQLLGFSAFFNRKGNLEIRGLTESNITITADNYFLHGLSKSEIQYQIAGITCKKDKETLTVGLRTGRSLELENSFMIQNILDDLYYDLKEIKYYPFSLDWQGHLKLDVGQWVTLKTNKNETYKVPVLSQSFSFKGGLKSKISADSKAGNDTQYSYKGFLTKQIEQMSTQIDAEIQQQLEYANAEFDRKTEEYKKELDDGIEQSKAEAEERIAALRSSLEELKGSVTNIDLDSVSGFATRFEELERRILEGEETTRTVVDILGTDGTVRYNKNILSGNTDQVQPFNADGLPIRSAKGLFKQGVTYTLSFESLCQLVQKVRLAFDQVNRKPWVIRLESSNPKIEVMETEEASLELYPSEYAIVVMSDWYQTKKVQATISKDTSLDLSLSYKQIADAQDASLIGAWSDSPTIIFDGGVE